MIQPCKPQPPPPPKVVKRVEVVKEMPKPIVVPEAPKPKIYNPVFTTPVVKQVAMKKVAGAGSGGCG